MKDEESGCAATPNGNSSFPVPHSSLKNVLLIDDDRIQLTLTAAMLQQSGINSVSCLQLDELLDALRTATFDVLLTDVQMPATETASCFEHTAGTVCSGDCCHCPQ